MPFFNIVAATNENTVVTEYEPVKARSDSYQSEAELEKEFIRLLCEQGYEYLPIHTEEDLIQNLRARLEELNDYHFSDTEWERFFRRHFFPLQRLCALKMVRSSHQLAGILYCQGRRVGVGTFSR